jgi:hypothetical protein
LIRKDNGIIVKKTAGDVFYCDEHNFLQKDLQELEVRDYTGPLKQLIRLKAGRSSSMANGY